jgi:hypothetical protein
MKYKAEISIALEFEVDTLADQDTIATKLVQQSIALIRAPNRVGGQIPSTVTVSEAELYNVSAPDSTGKLVWSKP